MKEDELWWAQRAKSHWLQARDKNSRYFHKKTTQRNKRNTIKSIQDADGRCWSDINHINSIFIDYFTNIFATSNPTNMQDTIEVVKNIIKPDMHEYLQQDFTATEVFEAIRQMKSSAAPGPDGLPALFYQSYWAEIGTEIIEYALNILNNNGDPGNINHTFLCLIPKVKKPTLPSDFRPIALCNVILKIIIKTIANRIKKVIPSIISPQQSAFLPNRLISDNTILAYEVFHF